MLSDIFGGGNQEEEAKYLLKVRSTSGGPRMRAPTPALVGSWLVRDRENSGRQVPTLKHSQEIPGEHVGFSLRTKPRFCAWTPCSLCDFTSHSSPPSSLHSSGTGFLLLLTMPSTLPPQDFYVDYAPCLEVQPLDIHLTWTLIFFGSLFKSRLIGDPLPTSSSLPFP